MSQNPVSPTKPPESRTPQRAVRPHIARLDPLPASAPGQHSAPLDLAVAAHSHPPDATPPEGLSIVIPMFNEAARAPATLKAVSAYFTASRCVHDILVVDDGSTDGTAAAIEALGLPAVVVLRLETNRG